MEFDFKTFASRIRVTDGAWGTQLQALEIEAGAPPEWWNFKDPSAVESVASSYVAAGSDVILTNTFGANRFILAAHGLGDRAAEFAELGAGISKRAARDGAKVFASIGPTGKIVMMGEVPLEDLHAAFAETAEALAFGGADAIILETFNELDEAKIALQAVKQACDLPVVVSMTFASGPDKTATMMGNKPEDLARMAKAGGAAAIGANCGVGPENYVKVAALLRAASDLPVWIKPNAGLPIVAKDGTTTFPMGPDEFAAYVPKLAAAGANFIGGCCGTTPQHVQAMRKAVDGLAP